MADGLDPRVLHPLARHDGRLPRPTWPSVFRLVLLDVCIGTPLAFGIGILEKGDIAALGPPILLAVLVFTLYADYAIVIDEVGLWQSFRSSLHVLARRPGASLGVTAAWLILSFILAGALGPSFDSGATPLHLTALLVFTGVFGFALDVCLITLYRATPPPPDQPVRPPAWLSGRRSPDRPGAPPDRRSG